MDLLDRLRAPEPAGSGTCELDDGGELDVEDAFGEHDIEYWVRRGNRLVPATHDDLARIQAWESERIARALVERCERAARRPWPLRLALRLRRLIAARHPRDAGPPPLGAPHPETAATADRLAGS